MSRLRILIADDHAPTRWSVRAVLEEAGHDVVGDVATAAAAIGGVLRFAPDVALLDIDMPGGGILATAEIKAQLPETTVVMLTVSDAEGDLLQAIKAGAVGYILKETDRELLPGLLESIVGGESVLPRSLMASVARVLTTPTKSGDVNQLSPREREVLDLLAAGRETAEIAAALFISRVTVRSHVAAIMQKLQLHSRDEIRQLFRLG